MPRFKLVIDNGRGYCAGLPERFITREEAEAAGDKWLREFCADNDLDFNHLEGMLDAPSFDVVE